MPKPIPKSIVIVLSRSGGRMQFNADYTYDEVKKIIEADDQGEWARFDLREEDPQIEKGKTAIRRKEVLTYTVLERVKDLPVQLIKPSLGDISKIGVAK